MFGQVPAQTFPFFGKFALDFRSGAIAGNVSAEESFELLGKPVSGVAEVVVHGSVRDLEGFGHFGNLLPLAKPPVKHPHVVAFALPVVVDGQHLDGPVDQVFHPGRVKRLVGRVFFLARQLIEELRHLPMEPLPTGLRAMPISEDLADHAAKQGPQPGRPF